MSPAEHLPRIFFSCAPKDAKYQELIAAKAKTDRLPLTPVCMLDGRTHEAAWQLECRRRIRGACAVVVLVSPHTRDSSRAMWQLNCAREEGKTVVGITVGLDGAPEQPVEGLVDPMAVIGWRWKSIAAVLMRLAAVKPAVSPFAASGSRPAAAMACEGVGAVAGAAVDRLQSSAA